MSLLEKLSDEFGLCVKDNSVVSLIQEETCMPNNDYENSPTNEQPGCFGDSFSSPAIKQQSCSGESLSACLRDSFEERLVEKLLSAQSKQFHELQKFVMAEISATNERLDDLFDDETEGQPPKKKLKESRESSGLSLTTGESPDAADDSILEKLSKQFDGKDKYGQPVKEELAKILKGMFSGEKCKADEEKKREDYFEKFKIPENCESLSVPKVNKEIWRSLPAAARNSDFDIQKPQKLIAHAIVPIIRVVDTLIKMDPQGDKDGTNETVNRLMEAISMMAMTNNEINHVRRNSIKPSLNADYRSLCSSQNAVTGNLFGDNITDQLKTIQESNKVGKKLSDDRPKSGHFSGNRRPFLGSRNPG